MKFRELQQFSNRPTELLDVLWQSHYPRIYDRNIPSQRWLADYVTTYLQRDVRQITQVTNLNTFTSFLKLCAGSTGQEVNFSRLGNDLGITHNTARVWLSILETSWLGFSLPAWHSTVCKQVIKNLKQFMDVGIASSSDIQPWLIYGGDQSYKWQDVKVFSWNKLQDDFTQ